MVFLHLLSFLSLFNADVVVALVECCVVVFEDYSKVHGQQQQETIKISRNVVVMTVIEEKEAL